ncbi:MAG: hypothetical protein AAF479_02610 [Pseudomonadota bacterium]
MSDTTTNPAESPMQAARETFSGKGLTESQFQEAWAITAILNTKIHATGSFRDTLTDYAHAYARDQRFDSLRGETLLRDVYKGRFGETMNQTRETLAASAENLPETARERALTCAMGISELIQAPPTQPFYKAYDRAATTLATEFKITQRAANTLLTETYHAKVHRDLAADCKEVERLYYKPARDAEQGRDAQTQTQTRSQQRA